MSIWKRMVDWNETRGAVQAAVVGAGYVGAGVVHRLERTPGMRAAVVVNRTLERGLEAYERAGYRREDIVVSDDVSVLAAAVASQKPAVTRSAAALPELSALDTVIEATGALDYGVTLMMHCLDAGLDVVSFNAEVDATVGWLLHRTAREAGAVYTIADGDQPGVLLRQRDFVVGMGFDVVAALNCKSKLDVHQNPDDSAAYSSRDKTSLLMTTAFGDGTKMQVENAVVANATGLVPTRRGMHGFQTTVAEVARDVAAKVARPGVVDFTLGGDFGAGVGIVGRAQEPEAVATSLRFLKMGDGPDYFFFRPFHLVQFEVPITIAEVALDRLGLGTVVEPPVAEVVTIAKRDLRPGEELDGIGGFCCYGLIDTAANAAGLLPVGLSGRARVTKPIAQDEPIALDAVELDDDAGIVAARRRQEALLANESALHG